MQAFFEMIITLKRRNNMAHNYPDFFNDVFGPVMQPGSSSHTAAPCRIALLARGLLGEKPKEVTFIMDREGSFAGTFGIMNEDRGMLAGVLGFSPDDERMYDAFEIASEEGLKCSYLFDVMKESSHLNALKIIIRGESGKTAQVVGDSTGGGMVCIKKVNGFDVDLIGDTYVLLVFSDISETQLKSVTGTLEGFIETVTIRNPQGVLHCLKASEKPDLQRVRALLPDAETECLSPVLPVIYKKERGAQLFASVSQWRQAALERDISMSQAALEYEKNSSLWTEEKIIDYMKYLKDTLHRQVCVAYEKQNKSKNAPFQRYDSGLWLSAREKTEALSGSVIGDIIKRTVGVNEKTRGTPIVPGPMGTGGGYLYSALLSVQEARGYTEEDLLRGLFVAAGVGAISYTHTSPTGEVVGCGGECGVCCAMGAAAIVEMCGGDGYQLENAASMALQAFIGLPCDPVVGGYEAPCFSRVIAAASLAVVYADLALAGVETVLPYHEMVLALDQVGRNMPPELLCTSKGGCCKTPAAQKCREEFIRSKEL
jgi:L-serine dehydratase